MPAPWFAAALLAFAAAGIAHLLPRCPQHRTTGLVALGMALTAVQAIVNGSALWAAVGAVVATVAGGGWRRGRHAHRQQLDAVLVAFLAAHPGATGWEVCQGLGRGSGSVYPDLYRLQDAGRVESVQRSGNRSGWQLTEAKDAA